MSHHDVSDLRDADLERLLGSKGRYGDTTAVQKKGR